ncbi:MAG: class I SAM-dependent methyltransferase [Flavobacteriales bacterium]|nr:class I SAM-dependent methyltransferase [Flavobacteriales bacterium]
MRAVYTYWTDGKDISTLNAGFNNLRDMAAMVSLSIRTLRRNNPWISSVQLVTNSVGRRVFADRYPMPFDEVAVILDHLDGRVHPDHWGYAKICAYAHQDGPFIHIDNDVVLWRPLSSAFTSAPLFFQNRENISSHQGYAGMLNAATGFLLANISQNVEWAYNCGIVGANDLDIVKHWKVAVDEFLFDEGNARYWQQTIDRHSTNHLFEQYFISSLARSIGVVPKELLTDFRYGMDQKEITHLWGGSKRLGHNMDRVHAKLASMFPDDHAAIMAVRPDHADVFASVYRTKKWGNGSGGGSTVEVTEAYREFLSAFVKQNDIGSVVDLGCGYWGFNGLVRWNGAKYHGIDVVDAVVADNREGHRSNDRTWEVADIRTCPIPPCDLLIIKDVLIHWTNKEVQDFFQRDLPARYILITNDDRVQEVNTDIHVPGEFRDVDITKAPFHINADVVFKWSNVSKSTWLISNPYIGS